MDFDKKHFKKIVVGPRRRALKKMISNAKAACRLALAKDDARALDLWSGKWWQAKCYLRAVNSLGILADRGDDIGQIIKHCKKQTKRGLEEYREAFGFTCRTIEAYREEFMGSVNRKGVKQ